LPGAAVLTLAGRFLFGWFWGGLASMIAATIGAVLVFLIARTALGEPLAARAGPWLAKLRQGFQEGAFNYLLFLRLVPIFPFWLVNLAPALLGVSFWTYTLATIIGIIPGSFAIPSPARPGQCYRGPANWHQPCLKMGSDAEELARSLAGPGPCSPG
jgi:uncharacterized membrane protein YdjX (TVP38/TMEM64 family)